MRLLCALIGSRHATASSASVHPELFTLLAEVWTGTEAFVSDSGFWVRDESA